MNTRSHQLEMTVEPSQINDVTKAIFHTILFHRSTGKFTYQHGNTFSVGSIGMEDVDCSTVDFTYIRCASRGLEQWVERHVVAFAQSLSGAELPVSGQITLEFYERRKARWIIFADNLNWEVWRLKLNVVHIKTDAEWQQHQRRLAEELAEKVQYICWTVNRPDYLPKNPIQEDLTNVFNTHFTDVQPYLHNISHELTTETMGNTVRKLIRNTFAY
ncbi:autophagy-related protein 101-like [Dysidea avara]|uniref:autophagy-related protein 101-like n=1 Tax=Dysidea avara TaxID=196820 RepID=UPI00331F707B